MNDYKSTNEEEIEKENGFSKLKNNRVVKAIKENKTSFEKKYPVAYSIFAIVIGIALLKVGGDFTVDNAELVAHILGLSDKLIALTIVAIGTSLPELITCIEATRKREIDLAIGNIAGSQIFNILLILGTSSTIKPVDNVYGFKSEILIILIGNIIYALAPFINEKHRLGRSIGVSFVLFYIAYISVTVLEELSAQV
jgi:cation:H+ antiporter